MYQPRRLPTEGWARALRTRPTAPSSRPAAAVSALVPGPAPVPWVPSAPAGPYDPSIVAASSITALPAPADTRRLGAPPRTRPLLTVKSPRRALLLAFALGISADILFYGKALGVSVPLFVLLFTGGLFALGWAEGVRPAPRNLWVLAPLFFFASMVFIRANAFLTFMNVSATAVLLGLLVYFYAGGRLTSLGLFGYWLTPLVAWANSLVVAKPVVSSGVNMRTVRERGVKPLAPVLRGVVLALPVLFVFTILLSSADTVFAEYVGDFLQFKFFNIAPDLGWHIALVAAVAWVVAGAFAYGLRPHDPTYAEADLPGAMQRPRRMGAVEAATVLVSVNLLFLFFVGIQFAYLFNDRAAITMDDSLYKLYARRGFGELVFVSILTLGLILFLRFLARHDTPRQTRIFNALSTHLVGLTLVILISAWMRMLNWEAVADYIYTEKRLYVRVFIAWLAFTLVWFVLTMWTRPARFAIGVFVAVLGFAATLNVMNPDVDVVEYNMERAKITGEIYVPYLNGLSEDAIPALVSALDQVPQANRREVAVGLWDRLERLYSDPSWKGWQSYHLARWQAFDALYQQRQKYP